MSYTTNYFNRGTGLSFIPFNIKNDVNTLKLQYTTLSSDYTGTSNLGNNLRDNYSNLNAKYFDLRSEYIATSNLGDNLRSAYSNSFDGKYNGNVMIYTKTDGIQINSNLYVDSNLNVDNTIRSYNLSTEPSLSLMNGETYTALTKPQIRFNYNGVDNYLSHYIHTTHSVNTAARNRMDFILCNGTSSTTTVSTNTSNVMSIRGDGRVGIGTTISYYTLDVQGTGRFTGALTLDSTISHQGTLVGGFIDMQIIPASYSRSATGTYNNSLAATVITGTNFVALGTKILISARINGMCFDAGEYVYFGLQVRTGGNYVDSAFAIITATPTGKHEYAEEYITVSAGTTYNFYHQITEQTNGTYSVNIEYVKVYHFV